MLKLSYLFCGILRYNGTECKLSFKISLKLKSGIYKLSSMRLFLILCSYAKIVTSSKDKKMISNLIQSLIQNYI